MSSYELRKTRDEEMNSKRNRKFYCQSKKIALVYIHAYENTKLFLGYKTALLYAKHHNINLLIWKKIGDTQKIELMNDDNLDKLNLQGSEQPRNTIHMVFSGGYTHFNLLVESVLDQEQLEPEITDLKNKHTKP